MAAAPQGLRAVRTLMEVVRLSTGYLETHGSDSPRLDAELLAAMALGMRRLDIYLQFDRPLEEEQLGAIRELVRRRGDGEPVAYITGTREFYGRSMLVTPDVLIPRPETETLVGLAVRRARGAGGAGGVVDGAERVESAPGVGSAAGAGLAIADLGTGSGCIAISLAAELPEASVVATDVSTVALGVAAANAARHGVEKSVALLEGSWAEPLAGRFFEIVVANPPYIPSAELAGLSRDVGDHEPLLALDGGVDGLDAYRALLPSLARVLSPRGWVALEVDIRAAEAVAALGRDALGAGAVAEVHEDLTGRPRVVTLVAGS